MKRRVVIILLSLPLLLLSVMLLRKLITRSIIKEDWNPASNHIVIENWSGDLEPFNGAMAVCERLDKPEVATIVLDPFFLDPDRRQELLDAAWDAGFDTTKLRLIRVPVREPRTFNIAETVIDSVHSWGWKDLTIVTAELHSARSRKVYSRAAERFGIKVYVEGVPFSSLTSENWYKSARGIKAACFEFGKRMYYEIAVF